MIKSLASCHRQRIELDQPFSPLLNAMLQTGGKNQIIAIGVCDNNHDI
jgi:hypothetical protein